MASALTITIQTFSDTVCPWCYIGKKNLDKAIETYKEQNPNVEFDVTWNPFYLHPEAKISAYKKKDYIAARFGPSRAAAFRERVDKGAAAKGLSINWDGLCGNTRDSHVLLLLAQELQQQQQQQHRQQQEGGGDSNSSSNNNNNNNLLRETQDALFHGAFHRGQDVSDRAFLAEVALEVGLCGSEDEVLARLDEEGVRTEADALDRRAKEVVGITAVPSYVVQGRYRVGGQQESEVFLRLFERIRLEGREGQ